MDPSEGIGTLALIGAGSGASGDVIGQMFAQRHKDCIDINWGETIGASIGGSLSAAGVPFLAAILEGGASEITIQIIANSTGGLLQTELTEIGRLAGGGEIRTAPLEVRLW